MTQPPIKKGAAALQPAPKMKRRALPLRGSQSSEKRPGLKVLYWGPPFSGKTTNALTYPGKLVLNFDPDSGALDGHNENIPVVTIDTWEDFLPWVDMIRARALTAQVQMEPGFEKYKVESLVLDSITGLAARCDVWANKGERNTLRAYGRKLIELDRVFDVIRYCAEQSNDKEHYNIVGTVHEQVNMKTDDKMNSTIDSVTPAISGSFGPKLNKYFSTVLLCRATVPMDTQGQALVGKPSLFYTYSCAIDQYRVGGDRYGSKSGLFRPLPPRMRGGSYDNLMAHWRGEKPK